VKRPSTRSSSRRCAPSLGPRHARTAHHSATSAINDHSTASGVIARKPHWLNSRYTSLRITVIAGNVAIGVSACTKRSLARAASSPVLPKRAMRRKTSNPKPAASTNSGTNASCFGTRSIAKSYSGNKSENEIAPSHAV
jgi:hypothetical protein